MLGHLGIYSVLVLRHRVGTLLLLGSLWLDWEVFTTLRLILGVADRILWKTWKFPACQTSLNLSRCSQCSPRPLRLNPSRFISHLGHVVRISFRMRRFWLAHCASQVHVGGRSTHLRTLWCAFDMQVSSQNFIYHHYQGNLSSVGK